MTFREFKYLSQDEQEDLLWERGVELARFSDDEFHYILFQVDGFYMELRYTMPQGMIEEIACFDDVDLLEPYLDTIDIDPLIDA